VLPEEVVNGGNAAAREALLSNVEDVSRELIGAPPNTLKAYVPVWEKFLKFLKKREADGRATNYYECSNRNDCYQPASFYESDGAAVKEFAESVEKRGLSKDEEIINSRDGQEPGSRDDDDSDEEDMYAMPGFTDEDEGLVFAANHLNDIEVPIGSKVYILEGPLAVLQGKVLAESEYEFQGCRAVEVSGLKLAQAKPELSAAARDMKAWFSEDKDDFSITAGETDLATIAAANMSLLVPVQFLISEEGLRQQQQEQQEQQQLPDAGGAPSTPVGRRGAGGGAGAGGLSVGGTSESIELAKVKTLTMKELRELRVRLKLPGSNKKATLISIIEEYVKANGAELPGSPGVYAAQPSPAQQAPAKAKLGRSGLKNILNSLTCLQRLQRTLLNDNRSFMKPRDHPKVRGYQQTFRRAWAQASRRAFGDSQAGGLRSLPRKKQEDALLRNWWSSKNPGDALKMLLSLMHQPLLLPRLPLKVKMDGTGAGGRASAVVVAVVTVLAARDGTWMVLLLGESFCCCCSWDCCSCC